MVKFLKKVISIGSNLEPAIWSDETGEQVSCFGRCQLFITRMSDVKEVHYKQRLYVQSDAIKGKDMPSLMHFVGFFEQWWKGE